jgi:uncharacterized protein
LLEEDGLVKILIEDIKALPAHKTFQEEVEELNRLYARGRATEYRFFSPLLVTISYYCSAEDIFFSGKVEGDLLGLCARCLEEYPLPMTREFSFVLSPQRTLGREVALTRDDLALSFYEGKEIDLSPLIYEQVILALPPYPLCREKCQGLCSRCGTNLNLDQCVCQEEWRDLRLAIFAALRVDK